MSIFDKFRTKPPPEVGPVVREIDIHPPIIDEPLKTVSPEEIKGNLPELTSEQLEAVKQAFLADMRSGEILVLSQSQRFFPKEDNRKSSRQLKETDLHGTGLKFDDLIEYLSGEQKLFLPQYTEGYRKYSRRFGVDFIRNVLQSIHTGREIPVSGARILVNEEGQERIRQPDFFPSTCEREKEKRPGSNSFLFDTRVGDLHFVSIIRQTPKKNVVNKAIKFAQINIRTPGNYGGYDRRVHDLTVTAFLGESNSKTHGNPSLKLSPEKQEAGSLAMLRRALKTDPQFLLKVFREFAPEAFELSDNKKEGNYYPTDGKEYPMRIVFASPGLNTVDFEVKIITDKK